MKPTERNLNIDSTLQGETINMAIDSSAMAHIMSILTDLYSDPEGAVIREYATNGFDAHVQNGVERPIEISLPNENSQTLRIRDFGAGLDAEDIRNIYSLYGASTKRDSNDVVGMLGLGCKSGLTYTDQFTIVGIKNGIATTVLVSRTEDGGGDMTLVSEIETTDESGVEVIIPVKARNDFRQKAEDLFRFWPQGSVLVNGEEPKRISGFWINENLLLTEEVDEPQIVMGNVPYSAVEGYHYGHGYELVAFVDIGAVQFTPSREALQFTPKTKAVIADVNQQVEDLRDDALRNWINTAQDHRTALQRALVANAIGLEGEIYWGDLLIPLVYNTKAEGSIGSSVIVLKPTKEYRVRDDESRVNIPAATIRDSMIVTDFEHERWSPHRRLKLEQWISKQENFKRPENFILVPFIPQDLEIWINDDQIMSWEGPEAEKIKSERSGGNGGGGNRPKGAYDAYVASASYEKRVQAEDLDTTQKIFWTRKDKAGSYYTAEKRMDSMQLQRYFDPNATVVVLGDNRIAKFQRDFPQAQNLGEYNKQQTERFIRSLTETQKLYLTLSDDYAQQYFKHFDASKIDDPQFKKLVEVSQMDMERIKSTYKLVGVEVAVEYDDPRENYPLLPSRVYDMEDDENGEYMEHIYFYMRATYYSKLGVAN